MSCCVVAAGCGPERLDRVEEDSVCWEEEARIVEEEGSAGSKRGAKEWIRTNLSCSNPASS